MSLILIAILGFTTVAVSSCSKEDEPKVDFNSKDVRVMNSASFAVVDGGDHGISVQVRTENQEIEWQATSDQSWIAIDKLLPVLTADKKGKGSKDFYVSFEKNTTGAARSGKFTIKSLKSGYTIEVPVTQSPLED